jgi:hypothetical protein
MTKKKINKAIAHLGIEIQAERGGGYSYFTDLKTGEQIGDSVMVCYLHHQELAEWVEDAERAKGEHAAWLAEY